MSGAAGMTDEAGTHDPARRVARIRMLNDTLRQGFPTGQIMVTQGVACLGRELDALMAMVRAYDDFESGNDPYGEHDFGSIDFGSERYFWKIDYYNATLSGGSEDPADPNLTRRVLTVMRADEY